MECSLCVLYNEYFYKSKCPRPCSIVQYSGRIDYWERKDSNLNDFSFRLSFRFASPAKAKVFQEYLIYNFFDLFGSVGAILGIFIGFFLSSLFNFLNNVLKKHDSNIQDSKLSLPKFYNISQNCYQQNYNTENKDTDCNTTYLLHNFFFGKVFSQQVTLIFIS